LGQFLIDNITGRSCGPAAKAGQDRAVSGKAGKPPRPEGAGPENHFQGEHGMKSKGMVLLLGGLLVLGGMLFAPAAFAAHHVTHAISPDSSFSDIVTDADGVVSAKWKVSVVGGTNIQFNLILGIWVTGPQEYPQTVTYGVTSTTGPAVPTVYFEGSTGNTSFTFNASDSLSTLNVQVNIIAPASPGAYTVKISPTAKGGDKPNLEDGNGVTISFTVIHSGCTPQATSLSITPLSACVIYRQPDTTFVAKLVTSPDGKPLAGKPIDFTIAKGSDPAISLGTVNTDANSEASLTLDTSGLAVGSYTVTASFQGDACYLRAAPAIATLGVKYDFLGFQPPVQIEGVGAGLFSGKVIPVKLKIADYYGVSVPDATIYLTWSATIGETSFTNVETESVSAADTGNLMRYDPLNEQYVYNWDVSRLANGDYTLYADMGEGCGAGHTALVKLQKTSGKKK
jgi:hypothetical protein